MKFSPNASPILLATFLLAACGATVRTVIGLVSGSTFAYFIQPVATTVALAVVFLGSVVIGRPVIAPEQTRIARRLKHQPSRGPSRQCSSLQ